MAAPCMRTTAMPRYSCCTGRCGAIQCAYRWTPCARDTARASLRSHAFTRLLAAVVYFLVVGWVGDKVQYVTGVRSREADAQCGERPLPDLLLSALPNLAGSGMLNVVSFAVVALALSWAWAPRRGGYTRQVAHVWELGECVPVDLALHSLVVVWI